ncbi:anti-sigma factor domain-containing protein [Streptomyces cremeus]|uniref:Anti-sigma factor domain-containing protein n=1 Tax=Streptomyces cremeus TaxID=66881 RepID=A0ABV5PE49_STRCM
MPDHLDPDELAALALGPADPGVPGPSPGDHLRTCARCRTELGHLREVVRTARGITVDDLLVEAPASLWESVAARLAEADAPAPAGAPAEVRRPLVGLAPARTAGGTVHTRDGPAGGRQVVLATTGLPATGGYYAVWLMDRAHRERVALGALRPDGTAALAAPAGVDLAAHPLVDVSEQDHDGDPAHSGRSVLRGDLGH